MSLNCYFQENMPSGKGLKIKGHFEFSVIKKINFVEELVIAPL